MKTWIAIVALAFAWSVPASAEDADAGIGNRSLDDEVDTSLAATNKRLHASGYRQITPIRGSDYRLSAYDGQGSEAILRIDMRTGEIAGVEYVHPVDK